GQVSFSSEIENYTGFQYITGEELTAKFQEHLERHKFESKMEEVQKVERKGDLFRVGTDVNTYLGKTVIIATGRKPRELKVPGEAEFKNRGVTYCATCDGPLFEGLDVAVVGGGNSGLEAVLQLIKIAKSIHLLQRGPQLKADMVLVKKAKASDKVKVWTNAQVKEIVGDKLVTGIRVQRNGKETLLPVQGVFVEIGSVPNSDIVDFVGKNHWGEIIVNCKCETNIPGLFAAGDVTSVPEKQIVVAAGEGCKAALSAFRYLSQR
ncbi:MAG: FAD-dependent oxidoreductase, partial [Candidatus Bathyarchaeota archaeon]|nr:FAD-dependent oxidoreductase [Candidatus Bathyarchaeota archaeon]